MNGVVVFDYDDTLVSSKDRIIQILKKVYGASFKEEYSSQLVKKLPFDLAQLYKYLKDNEITTDSFEEFNEKYYKEEPDKTETLEWTLPVLRELKRRKYEIIICSSNRLSTIETNLERLGLRKYFKDIITPDKGFQKSESNLIPYISDILEGKDFGAVLIGDSISDHILAHNSQIPFINVNEIKDLSIEEQIKKIEDKITIEPSNLLVNQYKSLRDEILAMQSANEKAYSNTILAVGIFWTTIVTIIFKENLPYFPSLIFSIPCLYALTSLSTYITNENRIANISSFIGVHYRKYIPRENNWEIRIGEFSNFLDRKVDLDSAFSTIFLYQILIFVALVFTIAVSVLFGIKNEWDLKSIVDLIVIIGVDIFLLIIYIKIIKKKISYTLKRRLLNETWESIP